MSALSWRRSYSFAVNAVVTPDEQARSKPELLLIWYFCAGFSLELSKDVSNLIPPFHAPLPLTRSSLAFAAIFFQCMCSFGNTCALLG